MQAARFSKVSRIYLITTLLFFVCGLGCSKEKNETPEDKSLPSGKVIESQVNGVTFDSVNGLVISGNSLNKLVSAKFKKDNDEIELGLVSKSTSQAKFSFPISRSLKSGLWSLVLTEAQAQGQLNMYLDAEDNSITDSKVVSVSASKVTGVLAPSVIPDLSSSYAPLTSGKVSHSSLPDLSSTYAPLTAGKVAASVVPDMSANYAPLSSGKVSSSVLPDLSSTYAPLTAGKVALSVVPDLSTIYASLTAGKIAPGSVPDLSGSYASTSHAHTGVYAPVSHMHTATDVGAVNVSTGATDAGKVPKLNSSGKIDSSMIPSRGVKPFIRTTRSSIADSSTDAAKDGLCQSEVGSSFYSATWQDASIYLNTPNGGCWLNYGNTVASSINPFAITGSVYGLQLNNCSAGSSPVLCISKESPYRTSRSSVMSSSSDSAKDTVCSSDLGSSYVAGTLDDYTFSNASVNLNSLNFAGKNVSYRFSKDGTYNYMVPIANGDASRVVFCVKIN